MMKTVLLTGGAGFAGYSLARALKEKGYKLICMVRPGSEHNRRLENLGKNVELIELDMTEIRRLPNLVQEKCHAFFHLAWVGGRDDFSAQYANVDIAVGAVEAAAALGCSRILITGSQAEYGIQKDLITEETLPRPFTAYGAAKLSAMSLTKRLSEILGLEWVWARIFSLYGKYEPEKTMLSYLVNTLKKGEIPHLSSCKQNWDYLDAGDGAEALIALMERGRPGEIYNVANGNYKPLKEFTEAVREIIRPEIAIDYASEEGAQTVSLQPSVRKMAEDTGWCPRVIFPGSLCSPDAGE